MMMSTKKFTLYDYDELKERQELLKRLIHSYTCYSWFDQKSPEEIESLKNIWKAELFFIKSILKKFEDAMIGEYIFQLNNMFDDEDG